MVQRRALRFIGSLKGICSISDFREKLGLDTLETRRRNSRKSLLCSIIAGEKSHEDLRSSFPELTFLFSSNYFTRSVSSLNPPAVMCNTNLFLHSFLPAKDCPRAESRLPIATMKCVNGPLFPLMGLGTRTETETSPKCLDQLVRAIVTRSYATN